MAIVTYENVAEAAESLLAEGQKASVRKVIERLGGGSPNAVLKMLGDYKAGRPVIRSSDIELDPSIIAAMVRQMRTVAETATADAEERLSSLSDDLATMAESNQSLEQRVEQLTGELATSTTTIERLTSARHDEQLKFAGELEALKSKLIELTTDLDKERERANGAQQELGKAQAKAEAVPILESLVAKLQEELKAEGAARAAAEQRAAVAEAQRAAAEQLTVQIRKDLDDARQSARQQVEQIQGAADKAASEHKGQVEQLRGDVENYRVEVREAAKKLDVARQQIDLLHEQLATASKAGTIDSSKPKEA